MEPLPPISSLSKPLLSYLHLHLTSLSESPSLVSQLQQQCSDLDQTLTDLNAKLENTLINYVSHSGRIIGLIDGIKVKLVDVSSGSSGGSRGGGFIGEELPVLAKKVARVEAVRVYAETALKLDTLVGDIEDAVSSTMSERLRKRSSGANSEETRLLAIEFLKEVENILASVTKSRPQWTHLLSAVDHRVDRALAVLRPQAVADHRLLLSSLGWPPPLSSLGSTNVNMGKSPDLLNPLFTMDGDLKKHYCENFLALCHLQELQKRRKSRQLMGYNREVALHQPLWAVEELVNPISLACQRHFSKWIENPDLIFALIYKITRNFVDSMDELLQPLVDSARLVGYSCREEWISAMVTSLAMYLAKEVFPVYVNQLVEDNVTSVLFQAKVSWLHLVDLMISFDKKIQSLIAQSGVLIASSDDENFQRLSSMAVFCDRPDWLELWAEIEFGDTFEKLKPVMGEERSWKARLDGASHVSGLEDYKAPPVTSAVLQRLSLVVDRCKPLPSISLRARFIRLAGAPLVREFINLLLHRCQEAEGMTALADDDALIKVTNSINGARYFESVLKEWSEDVFFLEMGLDEDYESKIGAYESSDVFNEEIRKLEEFCSEWVEKISTVVLRGFDARCREYIKNRKQWQEKGGKGWTVSKSFVAALDYLQEKTSKLKESLNEIDFVLVWRSLAAGVDRLVFNGVLLSSAKFHDSGVERFGSDLEVLFGVFRAWCLRPEGFFPRLSEGLKLLNMGKYEVEKGNEESKEGWLKEKGLRHLSVNEAARIVKNRVFED